MPKAAKKPHAEAKNGRRAATTSEAIDALFVAVNRSDAPGAVVGVAHNGRTIHRRAFGLANVALGIANTLATRMRIGSTSKHFACVAALLLAEEGKLDLDSSIRKVIPELPELWKTEPTLRQLMHHVGGLRCHLDINFIANGTAIEPAGTALATELRQADVNFAPGDKFIYCNGGYHLLSICIDRISGTPYEMFLKTRLFEPLGMIDTDSVPSDLTVERGLATLHMPRATGGWKLGVFPSVEVRAEGGMISTIDDMLRWVALLRTADERVLKRASWRQMFEPGRMSDGTSTHYALGLMLHPYRGVDVIHHAGGVMGGACQMLTVPGHALDIVVITNGGVLDPMETANKIVDTVLGDAVLGAPEKIAKTDDYKPLLGTMYRGETSGFVIGFSEAAKEGHKGELGLNLLGNPAMALRTAGGKLTLPTWGAALGPFEIALGSGVRKAPVAIEVREGATRERYVRVTAKAPSVAVVARQICADYASNDADATATIVRAGDGLELHIRGSIGSMAFVLKPIDSDGLLMLPKDLEALPVNGALALERDGDVVSAFRVHTGRTRGLRFARVHSGEQSQNRVSPAVVSPRKRRRTPRNSRST